MGKRRQKPQNRSARLRSSHSRHKRCGVVVLGMHRSGTSVLTRILNLLGCDLPATLLKADSTNEAGHWESVPIIRLNDRILESAGTNWYDWQEFYPDWFRSPKAAEFREEAIAVLGSEFGASHLFVLKDPRLCRILPFWLDVLDAAGVRPLVVSPLRNPLEVAASLAKRNGFDTGYGTLLWLRNVLDAESVSRGLPRVFTSFQGLRGNWRRVAREAQSKLGVVWPCKPEKAAAEIDAFISEDLYHHRISADVLLDDQSLPEWLGGAYGILSAWAETGEKPADFQSLDRIGAEFAKASPALSRLIAAEQNAAKKARTVATELNQARERITKTEASLASETQRTGRFEQELAAAKNTLAEKDKRIAVLSGDLAAQAQSSEKLHADINSRLQQAEAARANDVQRAARFEQELAAVKTALVERDKKIAALAGDLAAKTQEAEKTQADLNSRLAQAESTRAGEAQRAGRFEQELAAARNTLAEREKRLAALVSDLRLKTQTAEVAQASIVELGGRLQQAETKRTEQSQRAGQTERELTAARNALSEKERKISALVAEVAHESGQARQLENELEAVKRALNEKDNQLAALANELSLLAQASERMAEANAAELLRAQILEQALEELRNEVTGKDNHIAALAERASFHERSAHEVHARLFDAESEKASAAQRAARLESDLANEMQLAGKLKLELDSARDAISKKDDQIVALAAQFEQRMKALESDLASEEQRARHFQHEAGKAKGSLAESERRIAALAEEIKMHAQAKNKAEAALAEAQSRLAQTESALIQRRHEADQTAQELAKAQAELKQMAASATQNEKLVSGLKDHVNLLMADFKERQAHIEALDKKIREQEPAISQLKRLLDERERTVAQLQGKQKEHLDETVKLSRLAIDREQQANAEAEKARLIRDVAAKELGKSIVALLDNHKWSLLPRRVRLKRQMALLDRIGLFDREWYLQFYHDVRESGMDPLRHYAEYGAREGREPNSKFERPKQ